MDRSRLTVAARNPIMPSNFSLCPPSNTLPDFGVNLPHIPLNISVGLTPARESTREPMNTCCSPNPAQLEEGCYYWCQLPEKYADGKGFSSCLRSNTAYLGSGNDSSVPILGYHLAGASNLATGIGKTLFWAAVVTALLQVVAI